MSVLKSYFDRKDYFSPVVPDVCLRKDYDEQMNEIISFVPSDYPALIKSNGKVTDWSLNNLIAAGIDPAFSISTTFGTRLQGHEAMMSAVDSINSLLDSEPKNE